MVATNSSQVRKCLLTGFAGAGKSTLLHLFDGHPQICATQMHEKFLEIFTRGRVYLEQFIKRARISSRAAKLSYSFPLVWNGEIVHIKLSAFQKMLANNTYYHLIQEDALLKKTFDSYSSKSFSTISFDFDFQHFETTWRQRLFESGEIFTPEGVVDELYKAIFVSWKNYSTIYQPKTYIAFAGQGHPDDLDFVCHHDWNIKILFLDRDAHGVVGTRILRRKLAEGDDLILSAKERRFYIKHARFMKNLRLKARELQKQHPEKIMFIDMEDLILRTQETMPRILNFMGLETPDIVFEPTHLGQKIEGNFLGKINDQWQDALSKDEFGLISYLEDNLSLPSLASQYGFKALMEALSIEKEQALLNVTRLMKKNLKIIF